MLPNAENINDLIVDSEENKQNKTRTFSLNTLPTAVTSRSLSILGVGVLGALKLANTVPDEVIYGIGGNIDGLSALKQSIFLLLNTEADQYIIYPYIYGVNTLDLLGKPSYYIMAVLPERIRETLLSDDRITDVSDFEFEVNTNKITAKFVVSTIYGNLDETMEVGY